MNKVTLKKEYLLFRRFLSVFICLLMLFPIISGAQEKESPDPRIMDFIQIYHGYERCPAWHANQIKHYVYRDNNGKPEWLFDGFLFLEIYAKFVEKNYDYGATQIGKYAPDKAGWENLICKNFEDSRGPNGLEIILDSLAKKGYYPPTKRRVVFSIPNPIYGTKNWGFIDDKALDFTTSEDRVEAIKWYIDRTIEEWNKKNYKHLEFAGFYWIHEQIDAANKDDVMLKEVNKILKERGVCSYWLPHLSAEGVDRWKEIGFTYAYQQPNYFFYAKDYPQAVEKTMKRTKELNMGIMMEFDSRVIDQPDEFRPLFYNYVNSFKKGGVWENQPVNYYDGGDGWLRLSTSNDPEARKMYKLLGDIIVNRSKKFSNR